MKVIKITRGLVFCLGIAIALMGCQKQKGLGANSGALNPFTDQFNNDFDDTILNGGGLNGGGSNSGGLAPVEQNGLSNLVDEIEDVNPVEEDNTLDQYRDQLAKIFQQEAQGNDMSPIRMALASKVISSCSAKIAKFAPQPGETLIGQWTGQCTRGKYKVSINATIRGIFQQQVRGGGSSTSDTQNPPLSSPLGVGALRLAISGSPKIGGALRPYPSGAASHKGGAWQAAFLDPGVPGAGASKMSRVAGNNRERCNGTVSRKTAENRMDEKAEMAYRLAGQCYRKALILFSPVMDRLFANMDPRIAQLLLTRMLGIE